MLLLSPMASTSNGCFPEYVLHQEQGISKVFKDFPHLSPTIGSKQEISKSCILSRIPYEHDDLFKLTSELSGYSRFVRTASTRRMPLLDKQADYILFSFGIDEQWRKHKKLLQYLMSGADELQKDSLDPSTFLYLVGFHTTPSEMHQLHLARTVMEFNNFLGEDTSLFHPSGNYYDLEAKYGLPHRQLSFVGDITNVKDLVPVFEELKYTEHPTLRKQVLVPNVRWNVALDVEDHTHMSSLKLDTLTVALHKSCEEIKVKQSSKKKSKRATRGRALYKINSLQACEMLLSIMMDKKRNGKSLTNSLKKAGPELPLLLTQFSASITGTGLAIMFSVIFKMACGNIPFCATSLLTSGFGIGLFWLSWAVNRLRDTVTYIANNSTKFECEEMMAKLDKSVNDIFFRTAALMAVLILRFA